MSGGAWEPELAELICLNCDELHEAVESHEGLFGEGTIFAVVCPKDDLTSYYTREALGFRTTKNGANR